MLIIPIIGTNGDHLLETVLHDKTYILIMSAIPYKTEAVVNAMMIASVIQPVKIHWTLKTKTELLEMIFDLTIIILPIYLANPHLFYHFFSSLYIIHNFNINKINLLCAYIGRI